MPEKSSKWPNFFKMLQFYLFRSKKCCSSICSLEKKCCSSICSVRKNVAVLFVPSEKNVAVLSVPLKQKCCSSNCSSTILYLKKNEIRWFELTNYHKYSPVAWHFIELKSFKANSWSRQIFILLGLFYFINVTPKLEVIHRWIEWIQI